jgi:serine/threonine protein kinase
MALGLQRDTEVHAVEAQANPLTAPSAPDPVSQFVQGERADPFHRFDPSDPSDQPNPDPDLVAAEFPQLEILRPIGRGGMGRVFLARQPGLDRLVALKILDDRFASEPEFRERGIVTVYDFGISPTGRCHLLMEYVEGANLRSVLQAGRLAPATALDLVPRICEALQYAHDEGVIHRDIKPENILIDQRGRPRIVDFGLAKLATPAPANPSHSNQPGQPAAPAAAQRPTRLTASGMAMGTPHYMAPEQIEHPLDVDHRADVYALGVVLYEMLTGELPLGRFAPPSERAPMDPRLDPVVMKALERQPERRYQKISEVGTDIAGLERVASVAAQAAVNAQAYKPVSVEVSRATEELEQMGPENPDNRIRNPWGDRALPFVLIGPLGVLLFSRFLGTPPWILVAFLTVLIPLIIGGFALFVVNNISRKGDKERGAATAIVAVLFVPALLAALAIGPVWHYLMAVFGAAAYRPFFEAVWEPSWYRAREVWPVVWGLSIATGVVLAWLVGRRWLRAVDPVVAQQHRRRQLERIVAQGGSIPTPNWFVIATVVIGLLALLPLWLRNPQLAALSALTGLLFGGAIFVMIWAWKYPEAARKFPQGLGQTALVIGLLLLTPALMLYGLNNRRSAVPVTSLSASPAHVQGGQANDGDLPTPRELTPAERAEVDRLIREEKAKVPPAPTIPPRHAMRILITSADGRQTSTIVDPAKLTWVDNIPCLVFRGATGPRPDDQRIEIRLQGSVRGYDEYWIQTTRKHPEQGDVSAVYSGASFRGQRNLVFCDEFAKIEFLPIYEPVDNPAAGWSTAVTKSPKSTPRQPLYAAGYIWKGRNDKVSTGALRPDNVSHTLESFGLKIGAHGHNMAVDLSFQHNAMRQFDNVDRYEYAIHANLNSPIEGTWLGSTVGVADFRGRPILLSDSEHGQLWIASIADIQSSATIQEIIAGESTTHSGP